MQELIVSLHKNSLRISTIDKEGLKTATSVIPDDVVSNTQVLNADSFSQHLLDQIRLLTKVSKSNLTLNVVLEAQDTVAKFVTVNKRDGEPSEQIVADIKGRLEGVTLDELYFGYEKIAPFLYQFIGVRKDHLEKWISVATTVGIELRSVAPWVMALPKFQKINDPAIFVTKRGDEQVIVLSELNGVFFTGVYTPEKSADEIKSIVTELSLYKRTQPIRKVFTFDYPELSLGDDFQVKKMDLPKVDSINETGYSQNVLVNYLLDEEINTFTNINFMNLLPLPAVEKNTALQVYVKPVLAVSTLGLLLFGSFLVLKPYLSNLNGLNPTVLSEQTEVKETTQSTSSQPTPVAAVTPIATPTPVAPTLNKLDLKIRIENGAGVSGLAARSREYLARLGYTVLEIDTSEASSSNTVVKIKKSKMAYQALLLQDIKKDFGNVVTLDTLPEDSNYDVLMVLGPGVKL